jgi:hypothetical protein
VIYCYYIILWIMEEIEKGYNIYQEPWR